MWALHHGCVVLQLEVVLSVESAANGVSAASERLEHLDGGIGAVGDGLASAAVVLEVGFIDCVPNQEGLGSLHGLIGELRVVAAGDQVEAADAIVADVGVSDSIEIG